MPTPSRGHGTHLNLMLLSPPPAGARRVCAAALYSAVSFDYRLVDGRVTPLGSLAPASSATVAKKSLKSVKSLLVLPAGVCPGQLTASGTRLPPSSMVAFWPLILFPSTVAFATPNFAVPLSPVKITTVL